MTGADSSDGTYKAFTLMRDSGGRFEPTIGNVSLAVSKPEFCKIHIGFDVSRKAIMFHRGDFQWQPFDDECYTELRINLPELGFKEIRRDMIRDAVHYVAKLNRFDSTQVDIAIGQ